MRFWLKAGCDGFRVDMAGSLVKHDEEGKGTIALWQDIRQFLDKEFPKAAMVSEWGEPDKSLVGASTWTSCCTSALPTTMTCSAVTNRIFPEGEKAAPKNLWLPTGKTMKKSATGA